MLDSQRGRGPGAVHCSVHREPEDGHANDDQTADEQQPPCGAPPVGPASTRPAHHRTTRCAVARCWARSAACSSWARSSPRRRASRRALIFTRQNRQWPPLPLRAAVSTGRRPLGRGRCTGRTPPPAPARVRRPSTSGRATRLPRSGTCGGSP